MIIKGKLEKMKFATDRYLKTAVLIGGIYDIILGICLLFFSEFALTLLSFNPIIIGQTVGIFLIVMGYFLVIAAQDIRNYIFLVVGTCIIRFSYVILIGATWLTQGLQGIELGYLLSALTDFITALIILIPLLLTEGVSWNQVWQG